MKIVIVGPGAIGLLFAGLLSRSKEEIWILDHDTDRANRLKKEGFKIEGLTSVKVQAPCVASDPAAVRDADYWLVCVKAYDTKKVVKKISPSVKAGGYVLSLQNGLGNAEILSEALGPERVLVGVTSMGATLVSEGISRHAGEGETVIGRLNGGLGVELKELREVFQKAKIPVKISKDVKGVLWSKLIINVGINALTAITRQKNGKLIEHEGTRRILKEAVTEALKVAKRKRIKLLFDDVLAKTESVCEATAENVSSMLADVLRHKKTEIDFVNGAIVRQGESLGVKTTVNAFLVDLVKSIENGYKDEVKKI
ncbi:MAG: 2-dehydropantoate 2-reductase [Candidatus Omnitrophota bacterium]